MPIQADIHKATAFASTLQATAGDNVAIELAAGITGTQTPQIKVDGIESARGEILLDFGGRSIDLAKPIKAPTTQPITIKKVADVKDSNTSGPDLVGKSLALSGGTGNVGTQVNPIETSLANLEIDTTRSIFVTNDQSLTIGGIGPLVGLNAGGVIDLTATTSMMVTENVQAGGNVRLVVPDEIHPSANQVALADNVHITSTGGDLALLGGDPFPLKAGHQLSANGGTGEVVLGIDWGNKDAQGGTFTVPTQTEDVIRAGQLRIVGDSNEDNLIVPDLFLPVTFEGRANRTKNVDSAKVTLNNAPTASTTFTSIDVEDINFTHNFGGQTHWVLDTEGSTHAETLFDRTPNRQYSESHLASGGVEIVQLMHSAGDAFNEMNVDYSFGNGVTDVTVLAMRHGAKLNLRGGDDTVTVGGFRNPAATTGPIDPGKIERPLWISAGDGTDTFKLVEPRSGDNIVPIGRIGRNADGTAGLVQDYSARLKVAAEGDGTGLDQTTSERAQPSSMRRIEFQDFDETVIDLGIGDVASIFTVLDTVTPTTINAGTKNDTINIRGLTKPTTINLDAGDDTINLQGGGASLLTINGGTTGEQPVTEVDGGDRLLLGSTRSFNNNVVNVSDAPNAIKLFGTGWEQGEELKFTSDGTAPGGLTSGRVYYAVPFGRDIIRLAETRTKALAASASNENDPNIIKLTNDGKGTHQLTLAVKGQPLWPTMTGSLTVTDTGPMLSFTQPAVSMKVIAATDVITIPANHGFANGQRVTVFSTGDLPGGLMSDKTYFVRNRTSTSIQLSETANGPVLDISADMGAGSHFVVPFDMATATFKHIEKLNVLMGLGNDHFTLDGNVTDLSIELRGGPGNDTFSVHQIPNEKIVLLGESGNDDKIQVVLEGRLRCLPASRISLKNSLRNSRSVPASKRCRLTTPAITNPQIGSFPKARCTSSAGRITPRSIQRPTG